MDVVVASCAKYSDAWGPFVALFRHFWQSCPFRLFLVSDQSTRVWHGDGAFLLDVDFWWSKNLELGLHGLHSEHVLLLQEDFFLTEYVDAQFIGRMLHLLQRERDIACLRLMPCPGADTPLDADIGEIAPDAPYRVSCQAAIWRREHLIELLSQTTDTASFELQGTQLSRGLPGRYLSVRRDRNPWPFQYLVSAISRGKWNPHAIDLCRSLKIPIDTSDRPVDDSK